MSKYKNDPSNLFLREVSGAISRDFSWEELIASETAERYGITNIPGRTERMAMQELVKRLLQPLRIAYGKPIRISSGYRCRELNRRVNGSPRSQHIKGEAADCVVEDAAELLNVLLAHKLPFDQAILYRKLNFLHLSIRVIGRNRRMVIIKPPSDLDLPHHLFEGANME